MKYILLIAHVDSYFRILFNIARLVKTLPNIEPIIYFPKSYPSLKSDLKLCQSENITYYKAFTGNGDKSVSKEFNTSKKTRLVPKKIKKGYHIIQMSFLFVFLKSIKDIITEYRKFKSLNKIITCDLLLLAGDNIGYNIPVWIKAYQKIGVKSIIIPGWMAGPLEAFEAYKYNPNHQLTKISNRIVASIFPKYVYEKEGLKILRWHSGKICALKIFGLAPPKPWVLNSGFADMIFAESEAMKDYMVREGLQSERIIITGSISHDFLNKSMKNRNVLKEEICKSLNLNFEKPIILTALPPNQLYSFGRPDCEFDDYNELIRAWVQQLTMLKSYNVIVSIHPSQSPAEMKYIESDMVKIYPGSVSDLIPICDIYVASISATIQWAIACGIPVVNYDVYRYRYKDYNKVNGVINIENFEEYKKMINKIATDLSYHQYLKKLQETESFYWGQLDGNAHKRIQEIILQKIYLLE